MRKQTQEFFSSCKKNIGCKEKNLINKISSVQVPRIQQQKTSHYKRAGTHYFFINSTLGRVCRHESLAHNQK